MRLIEKWYRVKKSCPRCDCPIIDPLQRENLLDYLVAVIRLRPFNCRRCYRKFYLRDPRVGKKPPKPALRRPSRKRR